MQITSQSLLPSIVPPWTGRRGGQDAVELALSLRDKHLARSQQILNSDQSVQKLARQLEPLITRCDLTINVLSLRKAASVTAFGSQGYMSAFEYHMYVVNKTMPGATSLEVIEAALKKYKEQLNLRYDARISVEQFLKFGPDVKYLALSPWGSFGLKEYGDICLVIDPAKDWVQTYFDGDSGETVRDATDSGFAIDPAYLIDRFSDNQAKLDVFLANRFSRITSKPNRPIEDWLAKDLADPAYSLETHVHGQIRPENIRKVRIGRKSCIRLRNSLVKYNKESIAAMGSDLDAKVPSEDPAKWYFMISMNVGKENIELEESISL